MWAGGDKGVGGGEEASPNLLRGLNSEHSIWGKGTREKDKFTTKVRGLGIN